MEEDTTKIQGFLLGYMSKSAGGFLEALGIGAGGAAQLSGEATDKIVKYLMAAPVIAGAGAGYLHSKMTSPSKLDARSAQQAIELGELQEMEAELLRKQEIDKGNAKRGVQGERSLRI